MNADEVNATQACVADTMIQLLSEQRELYVRLGALTDKQHSLITSDQPQRLLAVLADRQKLIEQLERLAVKMRPYQQQWSQVRSELAESEAERVDQLLGQVDALLAKILTKDKEDAQLLAARKGAVGQEMHALKTGKQAGAAYTAASCTYPVSMEWTDQ